MSALPAATADDAPLPRKSATVDEAISDIDVRDGRDQSGGRDAIGVEDDRASERRLLELRDLPLLRRQDSAAFGRLVNRQQAMILGLCQSMGMRGADRDDAAAEVFAAVYKALPGFDGRASLATWIYRIAWRTIVKVRGRLKSTATATQEWDLPDHSPTPAQASETSEYNALLWQAVANLEPRQATAVELFYRRSMPVAQIADVLECPQATVNTLLFRARQQLKESLTRKKLGPDGASAAQ